MSFFERCCPMLLQTNLRIRLALQFIIGISMWTGCFDTGIIIHVHPDDAATQTSFHELEFLILSAPGESRDFRNAEREEIPFEEPRNLQADPFRLLVRKGKLNSDTINVAVLAHNSDTQITSTGRLASPVRFVDGRVLQWTIGVVDSLCQMESDCPRDAGEICTDPSQCRSGLCSSNVCIDQLSLSYYRTWAAWLVNHPIPSLIAYVNGGNGNVAFSVEPALPAGLTLDTVTGIVSGTPSAIAPESSYTIRAISGSQQATWTLRIKILDGFHVDSPEDDEDDNVGDGLCRSLLGTGPTKCTLRAAIQESNTFQPGREKAVYLHQGTFRISPMSGELFVTSPIVILGQSAAKTAIDGQMGVRVLHVQSTDTRISDLTIQNALALDGPFSHGGGIRASNSNIALSNVDFLSNATAAFVDGAALYTLSGTADIEYARFLNNTSADDEGAIWTDNTDIALRHSIVQGNIAQDSRSMTIKDDLDGAVVENCLFADNEARGTINPQAGGFYLNGGVNHILKNITFFNNRSPGPGTALGLINGATGRASHLTIANNRNIPPAGVAGAIYVDGTSALTIDHVLLEGNTDSLGAPVSCESEGTDGIITAGYNFLDVAAIDCGLGSNDIVGVGSANLGPVADNGGFVPTMTLPSTSFAVDSGSNDICASEDARGFPRPIDGNHSGTATCDIGAFER